MLLKKGSKFAGAAALQDLQGRTPLMRAMELGYHDIAQAVMNILTGAHLLIQDSEGWTEQMEEFLQEMEGYAVPWVSL